MSEVQRKVYKGVLMRDIDTVNGSSVGRTAILNIVMQLRKCCNHPYLFPNTEDRNLDPMGEHLVENCGKVKKITGGKLTEQYFMYYFLRLILGTDLGRKCENRFVLICIFQRSSIFRPHNGIDHY